MHDDEADVAGAGTCASTRGRLHAGVRHQDGPDQAKLAEVLFQLLSRLETQGVDATGNQNLPGVLELERLKLLKHAKWPLVLAEIVVRPRSDRGRVGECRLCHH